jgi:hypothetical protein
MLNMLVAATIEHGPIGGGKGCSIYNDLDGIIILLHLEAFANTSS